MSDWAERYFVLSPETSAEPGRWRTIPYQRGVLEAMTDPNVTQVTWKKSARIGYTLCLSVAMGYFIDHEPSSMLIVQPTGLDAEGFSKETIAPMLRDVPKLSKIVFGEVDEKNKGPKDATNTILQKQFQGGILSLAGANSPTHLRRISRRVVMLDEVDAYPPSAGNEGDPVLLAMKRSEFFWNRKIIAGSTPLIAGNSRIDEMFLAGDQRRYYVPCPHCGHMDFFRFSEQKSEDDEDAEIEGGHLMRWPKNRPEEAYFECQKCGCSIDETHKIDMLERGEWRAAAEFAGHASFHIWAAYSVSPNARWSDIAKRWLAAQGDPDKLKTSS
jgi:phage terminase large subunit GpA-like protein